MPAFVISTNVVRSAVPSALLSDATQGMGQAMNQPTQNIAVYVNPDQMMMFGGNDDPCAFCSVQTSEQIDDAHRQQYSDLVCGLLNKHLGISSSRVYINFLQMNAANVSWNNTTVG